MGTALTIAPQTRRRRLCAAVAAASLLLAGGVSVAGPEGGVVTGGSGSIAQSGNTTNVQQLTDRMSVQWQSFDVSRAETVNFLQPDSSSLVLNQILQNGPSRIDGLINANGHVLLVNPRGVIFGETSVINVGALTASTLWLDREDFLNGDLVLRALENEQGVVVNSGLINAAAGGVTLLGEAVRNTGLVTAELGYVNLASGREAYLTFDEEGFLGVRITQEVADNLLGAASSVENSGTISATGGRVLLQANVSSGLFDSAVNNSGIIEATGFDDGPGGAVHLLGDTVAVTAGARIHADGASGGGEILVGGDYQGGNPAVPNARLTSVAQDALLSASATDAGDGGRVIVWADDTTRLHGRIEARGGAGGGDGGLAEVSGKEHLWITGLADLRAPAGANGSLLLDPGSVTVKPGVIGDSTADEVTDGWINDQIAMGDTTIATDDSGDNGSPGSGDEDITFLAGVAIDITGNNTLTFLAGRNIVFDASTVISDSPPGGDLELLFGQAGAGGMLDLAGATISLMPGDVTIAGGAGTDTIVGATAYVVNADFAGTAGGFAFSAVENLTGTAGADTFDVGNGDQIGVLSGLAGADTFTIDGGTFTQIDGGADTDVVDFDRDVTVDLAAATAPFVGVETVNANDNNDTLRGAGGYTVTGTDAVQSSLTGTTTFNDFEDIEGTSGNDTFDVAGFAFNGHLFGLGGDDTFTLGGATGQAEITGGADTDTISGGTVFVVNADFAGTANGADFGTVENLTGTAGADTFDVGNGDQIGVLSGLAGADTFTIDGGTFTQIDGGADSDTVTFEDDVTLDLAAVTPVLVGVETVNGTTGTQTLAGATTYNVTGAAAIQANLLVGTTFNSFDVIQGTSGADTFNVNNFDFSGALLGLGGNDSFNLGGAAGRAAITGGADTDTIAGGTAYVVSGSFSGTANGQGFTGVENLTGSAGADAFSVGSGNQIGVLSGLAGADTFTIDGGTFTQIDGGADSDTVTFEDDVTLDLAAVTPVLVGVETVNGTTGTQTLAGATTYNVTGAAAIQANLLVGTTFNSFDVIQGTAGADTFNVNNFDFSGALLGLGGDDSFNLGGAAGRAAITGGADTDTIAGGTAYVVSGSFSGTANGQGFTGVENLTGSAGADSFTVGAAAVIGNLAGLAGADTFTLQGGTIALIDGGSSPDPDPDIDTISYTAAAPFDVNAVSITGIESVSAAATSILEGASSVLFVSDTDFQLDGDTTTTFSGFETVRGTSMDDTFTLAGFSYAGTLEGLDGADTFDLSGGGMVATILGGASALDVITGAGTYDISAVFGGTANASGSFSGIEVLVGSALADTFTLSGGTIAILSGLAGDDIFNFNAGSFGLIAGGDDVDALNLGAGVTLDIGAMPLPFTELEQVNAVGAGVTLRGASTYDVTGPGTVIADTTGALPYNNFATVEGTGGDDTFNINGQSFSGDFKGGGGQDTVSGAAAYTVNGAGSGLANGADFMEIENLVGTNGADVFTLLSGSIGDLVGLDGDDAFLVTATVFDSIDGGDPDDVPTDVDSVQYQQMVTIDLAMDPLLFTRIEQVVAAVAPDDVLRGANAYTITGTDSVRTGDTGATDFIGFEFVEGTAGADTFDVGAANFGGTLRGLAGEDVFSLDGGTVFSIDGGTSGADIDIITGGNHFRVTADSAGVVNEAGTFVAVESLQGSAAADTFILEAGLMQGLAGFGGDDNFFVDAGFFFVLDGGADTDTVNYQQQREIDIENDPDLFLNVEVINALAAGSILTGANQYRLVGDDSVLAGGDLTPVYNGFDILRGTADSDTFDLAGFSFAGELDGLGNGSTGDTVRGSNFYEVTGANAGNAGASGETTLTSIENLEGTATGDEFTLTAGSIGRLSGLGGNDLFIISDPSFAFTSLDGGVGTDAVNFIARVDLSLNPNRFTSIESVNATVAGSSLFGASLYNFVSATGVQAGGQAGTVYDGFDIIRGTAGDDTFNLAGNAFAGTLDGLGHVSGDTVAGASSYRVLGPNNGSAGAGGQTIFLDIERLVGTAGDDTFDLAGLVFNGIIDGLGEGAVGDEIRGSGNYSVTGDGSGTASGTPFFNIERLVGTAADDLFTFSAAGFVNAVIGGGEAGGGDTLSGATEYTVNGPGTGSSSAVGLFTGIENLVGTSGNDLFAFVGDGSVDTVDGRAGIDTADYSAASQREISTGSLINIERVVGGAGIVLTGMDWVIGGGVDDQVNDGTVDGVEFVNFATIAGTAGDDRFLVDGGSITALDGRGEGAAGDTLEGSNRYTVTGDGEGNAASVGAWTGIENLAGTAGDDDFEIAGGTIGSIDGRANGAAGDSLRGESSYTITGDGEGTAPSIGTIWTGIENLLGTAGADVFNLVSGFIRTIDGLAGDDLFTIGEGSFGGIDGGDGADSISYSAQVDLSVADSPLAGVEEVRAGVPGSSLVGGSNYKLVSATSLQVNGRTDVTYSGFDTLIGTEGDDVFDLGGFAFSGSIDGLGNSNGDRLFIVQDALTANPVGIIVDGATGFVGFGAPARPFESAAAEDFQAGLRYAGIEDFLLNLQGDLDIKGSGLILSSEDIFVGGSLRLIGPRGTPGELVLRALQDIDIVENLEVSGMATLDLDSTDGVVTVGQLVFVDTASGATINGFVAVNITEEPVLQLQVEEATSLSVFGDIDIFSAGRSSVARKEDDEIESESDLIDFLSGPGL